jgi:hypothetical protein
VWITYNILLYSMYYIYISDLKELLIYQIYELIFVFLMCLNSFASFAICKLCTQNFFLCKFSVFVQLAFLICGFCICRFNHA